jgi:long-chain acyl-CoA synthetase
VCVSVVSLFLSSSPLCPSVFKLSQGEYVSSETIESAYQKCGITGQVWVYGNSFKSFLLGVIVPAPEPTAAYLFSKGWWPNENKESTKLGADKFGEEYKAAMNGAHKAEIAAWVTEQLRAQEKPLKGYERVKEWIIDTDIDRMGMVFTEQNNTLTPTFKLRRPQLLQRYIGQLKELYGKNGQTQ